MFKEMKRIIEKWFEKDFDVYGNFVKIYFKILCLLWLKIF